MSIFRGPGHEINWKQYKRKGLSELRPYVEGEDTTGISISKVDIEKGSPQVGDMIARNPKNHKDQRLVAKTYFEDNLELAESETLVVSWVDTAFGNMPYTEGELACYEKEGELFIARVLTCEKKESNPQVTHPPGLQTWEIRAEILGREPKHIANLRLQRKNLSAFKEQVQSVVQQCLPMGIGF